MAIQACVFDRPTQARSSSSTGGRHSMRKRTDWESSPVYVVGSPPATPRLQLAGSLMPHDSRTRAGVETSTFQDPLSRPTERLRSNRSSCRPGGAAIVHEAPFPAKVNPELATP